MARAPLGVPLERGEVATRVMWGARSRVTYNGRSSSPEDSTISISSSASGLEHSGEQFGLEDREALAMVVKIVKFVGY